jgi:hypothetical protein
MSRYPSQKDKTVRAFQAFLNVMDTADWFENELRGPLESFDLSMPGFRVLEMLYREGALPVPDVARRRLCTRQNIGFIIASLEERGWVRQMVVRVPAAVIKESRLAKLRRGIRRDGPRVSVVGLTAGRSPRPTFKRSGLSELVAFSSTSTCSRGTGAL